MKTSLKNWEAQFDLDFVRCYPGDSGMNGNDPQEAFCEFTQDPPDLKEFIRSVVSQAYEQGYEKGEDDERKNWMDSTIPGQMLVMIRVRSEDGEDLDGLKQYIPVKGIVDWGRSFVIKHLEEITLKIITAPVLKKAIVHQFPMKRSSEELPGGDIRINTEV